MVTLKKLKKICYYTDLLYYIIIKKMINKFVNKLLFCNLNVK